MRAEELIAGVWKENRERIEAGASPEKVIMSKENYDILQKYSASLGILLGDVEDYITRYSLFGLTIYIDEGCEYRVE